jgi:hypothetical protein
MPNQNLPNRESIKRTKFQARLTLFKSATAEDIAPIIEKWWNLKKDDIFILGKVKESLDTTQYGLG